MYEARKTIISEKRIIRVIVNNAEETKQIIASTDKNLEIVIKENTATANSDVIKEIDVLKSIIAIHESMLTDILSDVENKHDTQTGITQTRGSLTIRAELINFHCPINTAAANSDVESKLNKLTSKVQEHDARIESMKDFMQSSMSEVLQKVSEIGNIVGLK